MFGPPWGANSTGQLFPEANSRGWIGKSEYSLVLCRTYQVLGEGPGHMVRIVGWRLAGQSWVEHRFGSATNSLGLLGPNLDLPLQASFSKCRGWQQPDSMIAGGCMTANMEIPELPCSICSRLVCTALTQAPSSGLTGGSRTQQRHPRDFAPQACFYQSLRPLGSRERHGTAKANGEQETLALVFLFFLLRLCHHHHHHCHPSAQSAHPGVHTRPPVPGGTTYTGFPNSDVASEESGSTWDPWSVRAHHQDLGRHCRPQFPFCGFRPVALNPYYTKGSPSSLVKTTEALPTAEPPADPPGRTHTQGSTCGWRVLPMSNADPDTWGSVGKLQGKLDTVRARGH